MDEVTTSPDRMKPAKIRFSSSDPLLKIRTSRVVFRLVAVFWEITSTKSIRDQAINRADAKSKRKHSSVQKGVTTLLSTKLNGIQNARDRARTKNHRFCNFFGFLK